MQLSLKNVKVHKDMSEETVCFSATLYIDGKRAADVSNSGHGGPNRYYFADRALEAKVHAWAKTRPVPVPGIEELDQLVDALLEKADLLARLKRHGKKNTMFRLLGDPKGQWRTVLRPYEPAVHQHLLTKYAGRLEHVVHPSNLEAALPYC